MEDSASLEAIKLVIIGDTNVGKTSLINRFVQDIFVPDSRPTIGVDFFGKKLNIFGKNYTVQIWDTAGQERFKSVVRSYFKSASAILLVFDLTQKATFEHLQSWLTNIQDEMDINAPIVVVGNKSDLVDQRQVTQKTAVSFAKKRNLEYYETSAENADGVDEVFTLTAEKVVKNFLTSNSDKSNQVSHTIDETDLRQSFSPKEKAIQQKKRNACCVS